MVDSLIELLPVLIASGILAGVLSGLLGIGGGIIMIPVLFVAFGLAGAPDQWRMHMALATSLAIIVPTSLTSVRAHHRRGAVDFSLAKRWAPFLVIGAGAGAGLASIISSDSLIATFGALAIIMGLKMILPLEDKKIADAMPDGLWGRLVPVVIGGLSSLMGIGGATFSVPYQSLFGVPIHRAVGTAALLGLTISLTGGLGYLVGGWHVTDLPPGSVGFISLPAMAVIAPLTVLSAPLGAKLAHKLSRRTLSVVFGIFLIASAGRMIAGIV